MHIHGIHRYWIHMLDGCKRLIVRNLTDRGQADHFAHCCTRSPLWAVDSIQVEVKPYVRLYFSWTQSWHLCTKCCPKTKREITRKGEKGRGTDHFFKAFVLITWMASVQFSNLMCDIVFVAWYRFLALLLVLTSRLRPTKHLLWFEKMNTRRSLFLCHHYPMSASTPATRSELEGRGKVYMQLLITDHLCAPDIGLANDF